MVNLGSETSTWCDYLRLWGMREVIARRYCKDAVLKDEHMMLRM